MNLLFSEFIFLTFFITTLINVWIIFITNNFYFLKLNIKESDKIKYSGLIKKNYYKNFIRNCFILFVLFYTSIMFFIVNAETSIFWNHFNVNSKTFYFLSFLSIFGFLCLLFMYRIYNESLNVDLVFTLINIIIVSCLLYYSSTFLSLFFVLEVISMLILYKFANSNDWRLIKNKKKLTTKFKTKQLKTIFNSIFYQYWSTFFSSIILVVFIINLIKVTGTTEITVANIFLNINHQNNYFSGTFNNSLLSLTFMVGLVIKLGLTPINFFKIEIYKGLPYAILFLYTTFYFLSFFLFFSHVFLNMTFIVNIQNLLILIILIGGFYLVSLIFDGVLIKSFLSFSTFINSFNFLLILTNSLN